jgi:hypothetical protein
MAKFRLYIDESGTHNYSTRNELDKRYLGLTGIIIEDSQNKGVLRPGIEKIKRIFSSDPDELPVLHREEIMTKSGPFALLQDLDVKNEFDTQLIELILGLDFKIIGIVIDKKSHVERYNESAAHPYHYCLSLMLERYTHFLTTVGGKGDVVAESRGTTGDMPLKQEYRDFYEYGTAFRKPPYIQAVLTSKEIKIKNKQAGFMGIELADILTLPTKLDVLHEYEVLPSLSSNFNKTLIDLIQDKYYKGENGRIKGYGKKLI